MIIEIIFPILHAILLNTTKYMKKLHSITNICRESLPYTLILDMCIDYCFCFKESLTLRSKSAYFFIHSTLKTPLSELEPNSGDLSLPMGDVICA